MPSLLRELAVSGSRKSDGSANASGKVFLYEPGTTTIVPGYKDDTLNEAWTTVGGGIPLDAGGRVKIWINDMIDVVISDSDGGIIDSMLGYNKTRAEQVEVENDGYTGTITDGSGAVSQGLGGITDLDTILTSAFESLGPNFQYQGSPGETPRDYIDVITEISISVKNFGAIGNGVADDTTAIQDAINRVKALGGGTVYFPPGTYKISAELALAATPGVSIIGAGIQTSIITSTSGVANGFTFNTCDGLLISRLSIRNTGTSTGKAISLDTCSRANVDRVHTGDAANVDGVYRYGIWASGSLQLNVSWSHLYTVSTDAAARAIYALDSAGLTTLGGELHANAGFPIEFDGLAGANMFGTVIAGSPRFAATMTLPLFFSFVGSTMSAPSIATATIPVIRTFGTTVEASATSSAVGAAQTPSLIAGKEVILTAASGGAGTVTVNTPALLPGTGSDNVNYYWDFVLKAASGGGPVNFTFSAGYVVTTGPTIAVTDLHTTCVRFRWDRISSKLREVSRADTVT